MSRDAPARALAIARTRLSDARIVLLDEPLEGLAPIIIDELLKALRQIVREEGLSAILVEHNAKKILGITDRVVILERGMVAYSGDSVSLKDNQALLDSHLGVAKTELMQKRRGTEQPTAP